MAPPPRKRVHSLQVSFNTSHSEFPPIQSDTNILIFFIIEGSIDSTELSTNSIKRRIAPNKISTLAPPSKQVLNSAHVCHRNERRSRLSSVGSRLSSKVHTRDASLESVVETTCNRQGSKDSAGEGAERPIRTRENRIRNKRIILTAGKKAPIAILSSIIKLHQSSGGNSYTANNNVPTSGGTRIHRTDSTRRSNGYSSYDNHFRSGPSNLMQLNQYGPQYNESSRSVGVYHSDPTDLFALMNLEKPGSQDISYANIFLRPVSRNYSSQAQQNCSSLSYHHATPDTNELFEQPTNSCTTMRSKSHYLSLYRLLWLF